MIWRESGGPAADEPARRGFGLRMIEANMAGALDGTGGVAFRPDGVQWTLRARLSDLQD